jgi:23S rRNA pseudouridine2605 synthase
VLVNGAVVRDPRAPVDPTVDRLEVDGLAAPAARGPARAYALHKPRGVLTTRAEPRGRATVYDLLPAEVKARWIFPIGRLDRDSEGLLLFTDDGALSDRLTAPRHDVEKLYLVDIDRPLAPGAIERLRAGIELDGRPTRPARVAPAPGGALEIGLREGRNRQVRRMIAAVGGRVTRLVRVRMGPIALGDLAPGAGRWLTDDEVRLLAAPIGERDAPDGGTFGAPWPDPTKD